MGFASSLKPPVNYVIIAIVIGSLIVKQMTQKKKDEKETSIFRFIGLQTRNKILEEFADIEKIEKDSEYSNHAKKIRRV